MDSPGAGGRVRGSGPGPPPPPRPRPSRYIPTATATAPRTISTHPHQGTPLLDLDAVVGAAVTILVVPLVGTGAEAVVVEVTVVVVAGCVVVVVDVCVVVVVTVVVVVSPGVVDVGDVVVSAASVPVAVTWEATLGTACLAWLVRVLADPEPQAPTSHASAPPASSASAKRMASRRDAPLTALFSGVRNTGFGLGTGLGPSNSLAPDSTARK